MKEENLRDEDELQSWFVSRIVRFLADQGRQAIGWDEILEGGLAPGALVMSWQGERGGIAAARMGHDVVMSPMKPCYFDWKQADTDDEPGFHGVNILHEVYHYQFIPAELTPEEAKHVLGGQANIWTERMTTPSEVEFMILPRLCALAEALWSAEERDWNSFQSRLHPHLERLNRLGYHSRSV
jgi:hexosaminidase